MLCFYMTFNPTEYANEIEARIEASKSKHHARQNNGDDVETSGGGALLFNGAVVDGGENRFRVKGRDSVQLASAGTEHLTRGRVAGNPERRVDNLEYDGVKRQWYRMVNGERVYE